MANVEEALQTVNEAINAFFDWRQRLEQIHFKLQQIRDNLSPQGINCLVALTLLLGKIQISSHDTLKKCLTQEISLWTLLQDNVTLCWKERDIAEALLEEPEFTFLRKEASELKNAWERTYKLFNTFPTVQGKRYPLQIKNGQSKSTQVSIIISPSRELDAPKEWFNAYQYLIEACAIQKIPWKTLEQQIITKITGATLKVLSNNTLDTFLGNEFHTNITIYVFNKTPHNWAGFVSRLKRFFERDKQKKEIIFASTPNDIRFSISAKELVLSQIEDLARTFTHEITHALDRGFDWNNRTALNQIREEGIARFSETITEPKLLKTFWIQGSISLEAITVLPLKPEENFEKILKDPLNKYVLGLGIVLQCFLATIGKEKEFGKIPEMQRALNQNKKQATSLLNILSGMQTNKFFEYYMKKVKEPLFTKEFINKIQQKK